MDMMMDTMMDMKMDMTMDMIIDMTMDMIMDMIMDIIMDIAMDMGCGGISPTPPQPTPLSRVPHSWISHPRHYPDPDPDPSRSEPVRSPPFPIPRRSSLLLVRRPIASLMMAE